MNALAERSTVFRRAYCAQPVCGPARACLFTGTWPHYNGQVTLLGHPMHDHIPCLTDLLDDRWVCGFFGRSGHHRYAGGPAPRADGIDELDFNDVASDHLLRAHGFTPADGVRFGKKDRPAIPSTWAVRPTSPPRRATSFAATPAGRSPSPSASTSRTTRCPAPWTTCIPSIRYRCRTTGTIRPAGPAPQGAAGAPVCAAPPQDGIALRSELAWRLLIQRYWGLCTQVDRALGRVFDQLDRLRRGRRHAGDPHRRSRRPGRQPPAVRQEPDVRGVDRRAAAYQPAQAEPGPARARAGGSRGHRPDRARRAGRRRPEHLQGTSLTPWLDGADPPPRPAFVEWTGINYLVHEDLKRDPLPGYLRRGDHARGRAGRSGPTPCAASSRPRDGSSA